MIPNPNQSDLPMFKCCLDWILNKRKEAWFSGDSTDDGRPTIDSFPATLACMIALKTWNTGVKNIKKEATVLDLLFHDKLKGLLANVLFERQCILERLSCPHNDKLMQLLVENYEFQQSIYRNELEELKRWEGKGLSGHGKTIFEALHHLVSDIAAKHLQQEGRDLTQYLLDIKELEVGKMNLVLLYLKENPQAEIEESIAYVRQILDEKKKELLEIVLMDDSNDLP
ncbi:hypothetical protein F0562_014077 [Nyssa sinensis]|uniref:Terpene synthase N-terminal domain-containing protein n=1 Tax=Nyssa sinensis TaxID=561372 RepID=A0A5J4ZLV2_9ASTE|nr:hypothetical protein F0562_014077 [Nyssa sinensis]